MPFSQFFRRGMGTEYVSQFLYSMVRMTRPTRLMEIGLGYTTPWLLRALDDNVDHVHIDRNCNPEYFRTPYDPILLCIDDLSISDERGRQNVEALKDHRFLRFFNAEFQGRASEIHQEYGDLDFVWFDCGGRAEYEQFCEEYLPICSGYVFFHYTYSSGVENDLSQVITSRLARAEREGESWFRTDIVEPHKHSQGSVTMIRRKSPMSGG